MLNCSPKNYDIKEKNIQLIDGVPLVARTIKQAKSVNFSRVIVVTDDEKISEVSKKAGAEVPFIRPKKISGSKSHMFQGTTIKRNKIFIATIFF